MILSEIDLDRVLDHALGLGVTYADVRYQRRDSEQVQVENGVLKNHSSQTLGGAGIRVVYGGSLGFASTSDLSWKSLEATIEYALKGARSMFSPEEDPLCELEVNTVDVGLPTKNDPFDVPPEEKVGLVLDANKAALTSEAVKSRISRLGLVNNLTVFKSSDGADVRVRTPLVGFGHSSVAEAEGVKEVIGDARSMCAGYEFIAHEDWNEFSADISRFAEEAVRAKHAPPGTYPVVIEQDVVGLVLHEALGHACEGDAVANNASVLAGKLGSQVATEQVTIVDEGVVQNGLYHPYDDEGAEKGRTTIIEDGVLKGFLTDRRSAQKLGMNTTGNGRSQNFENIPIVRQTNYYMMPGDQSLEEMVEGIDHGLLVQMKGGRGGQVDPGMGTFTFGVGPSRIIRDGELQELVRGVVISGSVLDTLKTVDAVGKDFKVKTSIFGGCGKMGQQVKTGMGGPPVRVQRMTVGGRRG